MSLSEVEMSLRDGTGIIPPEHRNRGYEKLDWEPGEGGLGDVTGGRAASSKAENQTMKSFLAGVAAGADPKDLAKGLLGEEKPRERAKSKVKEAVNG